MSDAGSVRAAVRRAIGAWSVVAFLVTAIAFYRTAPDLPDAAGTAETSRGGTSANGPGATEPGIRVVAAMAADGSFDVSESVVLSAPTDTIEVRPPDLSAAGNGLDAARPTASSVQITAHDQPVPVPGGAVDRPRSLTLETPVLRYEIRYRLTGATVRSLPSKAGRALAAIAPLTTGVPDDLPVAVAVAGDSVRTLSCPGLPLPEQACATGAPPRLHVDRALPRRTALVVAQLDLPVPGEVQSP